MKIEESKKKCSTCKEFLILENFARDKNREDGRHYSCKFCTDKFRDKRDPSRILRREERNLRAQTKTKYCPRCKKTLLFSDFGKKTATKSGLRSRCKQCRKEVESMRVASPEKVEANRLRTKEFYWNNREHCLNRSKRARNRNKERYSLNSRKTHLKNKYGLSIEEFSILLETQNYKCKICKILFSDTRLPTVDHSHKTGKVRAVLCNSCNTGLGMLKDSLANLLSAVEYLEVYGE